MLLKRDISKKIERVGRNENGEYHGFGTIKWHSGSFLKAEWNNGTLIKIVEIRSQKGVWYYQGSEQDGYTCLKTRKSERYEYKGQVDKFGQEDGKGEKTYKDKTVFKGSFKSGKFISGQVTYPNNSVFIGKFNENQEMHDYKCIFTFPDGRGYYGSILNDGQSGEGFIGQKFVRWANKQIVE